MSERRFWKAMHYRCQECQHTVEFLLEEGCEGPRDKMVPTPPAMLDAHEGPHPPFGFPTELPATGGGRIVLPVPFIGCRCPRCDGLMSHIDWHRDRRLVPMVSGAPGGPHFLYPDDPHADRACGVPVVPWKKERQA